MSKAFTSEDTASAAPEVRRRARTGEGPRYVTPEGRAEMNREADRLRGERQQAVAQGTIGSGLLADLDAKLEALAELIADVTVVHPDPAQEGRVFFGAWVTVEDEVGETFRYRIVGPDEADARSRQISVASPLGRALLGKEAGDVAIVERPRGAVEYTVKDVRYRID